MSVMSSTFWGQIAPPTGSDDDSANQGGDNPPQTQNQDDPTQDQNQDDPTQDQNQDDPPQTQNQDDPTQDQNQDDPPQNQNQDDPPQTQNQDDPPQTQNQDDPPQTQNQDDPPQTQNQTDPSQDQNQSSQDQDSSQDQCDPAQDQNQSSQDQDSSQDQCDPAQDQNQSSQDQDSTQGQSDPSQDQSAPSQNQSDPLQDPVLQSITIDPPNSSIADDDQQPFIATGLDADGNSVTLASGVAWISSDPAVVSINNNGLASAQSVGSATITATETKSGLSATASITIKASVLESITIDPPNPSLVGGGSGLKLSVTGLFSDGHYEDLTSAVVWSSSPPGILTIDNNGNTSAQPGSTTATVTATHSDTGKIASAEVTVTDDDQNPAHWEGSRGLSGPERIQASNIYQNSINYDKVTVNGGSAVSAGALARTVGNSVYLTDSLFDGNTSNLTSKGMATLIHELGHVWQYQTGGTDYIPSSLGAQAWGWTKEKLGGTDDSYNWRKAMNDGEPWEKWNAEQQAEAMEDYYKAKKRLDAGTGDARDRQTVSDLEQYVGKVRSGQGAPGEGGPDPDDGGGGAEGSGPGVRPSPKPFK